MQDPEFNLRRVFGILWRHLWLILLAAVVSASLAGTALLSLSPVYSASALVLVDPTDKNLLNPTTFAVGSASENARVESEVEIAMAETTLRGVLFSLDLLNDPDFMYQPGWSDRALARLGLVEPVELTPEQRMRFALNTLRDNVYVERQGLSYLMTITGYSGDPDKAAAIANTLAEHYIAAQVQTKVDRVLAGRDAMSARLSEATTAVIEAEQAFGQFIIDSAAQIAAATGRTDINTLRAELAEVSAARSGDASAIQLAETGLAQADWLAVANALESQSLREIQDRYVAIQAELARTIQGSTAERDLRNDLVRLIDEYRSEATIELEALRQQVAQNSAREADLRLQLRSIILSSNLPPSVLASMYELQQNANVARSQYEKILARLRDIEAQSQLQLPDSHIVSEAAPPDLPIHPNPPFLLISATLGGLTLGVMLAFFRENYASGINSPEELESILGTSLISTIPYHKKTGKDANGEGGALVDLIVNQPYSAFAESIRRIRVAIDQSIRRLKGSAGSMASATVILVTSADAGEGKTTLALSLARAYALSGRSTVLVDANVRRPGVHKMSGLQLSKTLANYLAGTNVDLASVLQIDKASGARIVTGLHQAETSDHRMFSGEMFSPLLTDVGKSFDVVVIDTPPVGSVVDALYLAQHADIVVTVVRWHTTPQRDVRAAQREIGESKNEDADILFVLNALEGGKAERRRLKDY